MTDYGNMCEALVDWLREEEYECTPRFHDGAVRLQPGEITLPECGIEIRLAFDGSAVVSCEHNPDSPELCAVQEYVRACGWKVIS